MKEKILNTVSSLNPEIDQNELVKQEIAEKYQEFYNPMGDYLRLILNQSRRGAV